MSSSHGDHPPTLTVSSPGTLWSTSLSQLGNAVPGARPRSRSTSEARLRRWMAFFPTLPTRSTSSPTRLLPGPSHPLSPSPPRRLNPMVRLPISASHRSLPPEPMSCGASPIVSRGTARSQIMSMSWRPWTPGERTPPPVTNKSDSPSTISLPTPSTVSVFEPSIL